MRNVIIWHSFIKNLLGTWRQNEVDATLLRRIDVSATSCACWEFGPPPIFQTLTPPQYSKPSYAYVFIPLYHIRDHSLEDVREISCLS